MSDVGLNFTTTNFVPLIWDKNPFHNYLSTLISKYINHTPSLILHSLKLTHAFCTLINRLHLEAITMALSLHTVFLCKEEIVNLYAKSACHERTHRIGSNSPGIIMMKVRSNYGYYKCLKLFTSYKMNRLSDFSTPLSHSKKKSPICSINAVEEIERFDIRRGVTMILERQWRQFIQLAIVLVCTFVAIPNVDAVDALKTCTCLLKECRIELAKCIANPSCAANVACLQTCNNRPDETECQIKCGDLFENSVVDEFNECAVSRKKCVPRKSDVGEFPVPDPSALVKSFNMKDFSGKWYITSGLNPTFDIFDCQLHEFHTEGDKLVGNLTWRIKTPDGGFFTRSAVQTFVQDPNLPGALYNHDNEFLHYQDDWYILSAQTDNKPDDYIFVYYRGRNDAWDGYGGAVLYTRSSTLPQSIVPRLQAAAQSVGRNFDTFTITDNTCGPEPPLVERLEKKAEEGEKFIIKEAEEVEKEVEKEVVKVRDTEVSLFERLIEGFKELQQDEEYFLKELSKEEKEILNDLQMEATEVEKLFGRALPLRKLR